MATQLRFAKLHLKNHRTSGAMTFGDIKYDKNAEIIEPLLMNIQHSISANTSYRLSGTVAEG